jgi:Fungal specific transcription factor domain
MAGTYDSEGRVANLSQESTFVLNGMFALSARFSNSEYFSRVKPTDRGVAFAKRAQTLFEQQQDLDEQPTLRMMQGCILLACYYLTSGISSQAWILTGVCVRMAYELGLHDMDHNIIVENRKQTPQEWVIGEEKRRAWWSAWELDNFASTISDRPYCFDRNRAEVLLPVSDNAWFSNTPVASAALSTDPLTAWKSLDGCPNQDERAWFLVSVYLVRLGTELFHLPKGASSQMHKDHDTAISCFALVLPSKFDISGGISFDGENWKSSSWIISTHLMIQGSVSIYVTCVIFSGFAICN